MTTADKVVSSGANSGGGNGLVEVDEGVGTEEISDDSEGMEDVRMTLFKDQFFIHATLSQMEWLPRYVPELLRHSQVALRWEGRVG